MKLILVWVIFSSILSITIALNAHKVIPAGEHTTRYIIANTELYTLRELLKKESINKNEIQSLINKKMKPFKGIVIDSQLESIPKDFVFLSLIILNTLNIIFVLICFWYIRNKPINTPGASPLAKSSTCSSLESGVFNSVPTD